MFYVYRVTNILDGMFYVGRGTVRTKIYGPEKDSYLGSGIVLKRAIQKYGREFFKKEILELCDTVEQAKLREAYWIKYLDALNPEIAYNLTPDSSGFTPETSRDTLRRWYSSLSEEEKKQLYEKRAMGVRNASTRIRQKTIEMWAKFSEDERQEMKKRMSDGWTPELRQAQQQRMLGSKRKSIEEYMKLKYGEVEGVRIFEEWKQRRAKASTADEVQRKRVASFKSRYAQCPLYAELNKKVRQPRAALSRMLNRGTISQKEYDERYAQTINEYERIKKAIEDWKKEK